MFGLSQSLHLCQKQELSQRLSAEQRIAVQTQILTIRLELIGMLRAEQYRPRAECPGCRHLLTPLEIIKGFSRDPNDFNTTCPSCNTRFLAQLRRYIDDASHQEYLFYCKIQALEKIRIIGEIAPSALLEQSPALYYSLIAHCGTLTAAYKEIGISYQFREEGFAWRDKVGDFLGKLPDTMIARCVGTSAAVIRRMRCASGIPRYTVARALA